MKHPDNRINRGGGSPQRIKDDQEFADLIDQVRDERGIDQSLRAAAALRGR
jgi:hypothetical protein